MLRKMLSRIRNGTGLKPERQFLEFCLHTFSLLVALGCSLVGGTDMRTVLISAKSHLGLPLEKLPES